MDQHTAQAIGVGRLPGRGCLLRKRRQEAAAPATTETGEPSATGEPTR